MLKEACLAVLVIIRVLKFSYSVHCDSSTALWVS